MLAAQLFICIYTLHTRATSFLSSFLFFSFSLFSIDVFSLSRM